MFGIIGWIIIGGFVGWLASRLMGRSGQQGCLGDVIVGIVGAFIGGLGYNLLTGQGLNLTFAFDTGAGFWISLLVSVIGAVVLLAVVGWFQRR
jgi:uncharacterized membrane protein YeaQ/YmgE (transglycosylase-associated protein family)